MSNRTTTASKQRPTASARSKSRTALREVPAQEEEKMTPSLQLRFFKVFIRIAFVMFMYSFVLTTAQYLIPMLAGFFSSTSGLKQDAGIAQVIASWLLPVVFMVGMMMWVEIKAITSGWRWVTRVGKDAESWPIMQKGSGRRSASSDKDDDSDAA